MSRTRRTFRLDLHPDGVGGYHASLAVSTNGAPHVVAGIDPGRIDRLRPALLAAVTASNHPRTVLSPTRKTPIPLTENAGLRLALTTLATAPLRKTGRVDAIRHGIDQMTDEETHYWYALGTGPNRHRALRALRTLLAEE
jgi:hypothetical protein